MNSISKRTHVGTVCEIVNQGYDVNRPVMYSNITLTMHAATLLDEAGMAQILGLNPDLQFKDEMGRTALHLAARSGNMAAFKVIMDKYEELDLEVDQMTIGGVTPLMSAI